MTNKITKTKVCKKCGINKPRDEFSNRKDVKDGKQSNCKLCRKQYRVDNHEYISKQSKIYNKEHKSEIAQYRRDNIKHHKQYLAENAEYISKQHSEWIKNNPDKVRVHNSKTRSIRKGWEKPLPINEYFEGSHLHHLHIEDDHQICIYVPVDLHTSISHAYNRPETMNEINYLVMMWLLWT